MRFIVTGEWSRNRLLQTIVVLYVLYVAGLWVTNFLLYFLRAEGTQAWLQRQVKGATFREITLTRLRQMPIQPLHLEGSD